MAKSQAERPFEVYCTRCNVTFPAETRHCIHCGGRLSREAPPRVQMGRHKPVEVKHEVEELMPIEPDEEPRRSPFSPVALLWLVLLVVGSIYRACAGS